MLHYRLCQFMESHKRGFRPFGWKAGGKGLVVFVNGASENLAGAWFCSPALGDVTSSICQHQFSCTTMKARCSSPVFLCQSVFPLLCFAPPPGDLIREKKCPPRTPTMVNRRGLCSSKEESGKLPCKVFAFALTSLVPGKLLSFVRKD